MVGMQTRSYTAVLEIRGDGRLITGLVAPYNTPVMIRDQEGSYAETFVEDSFVLHGSGVPLYSDHPLGRAHDERDMPVTPPGDYRDNDTGLLGQWRVPRTAPGDALLEAIRTGRAGGLSVGFVPGPDDDWSEDRTRVTRHGALLHHVAAAVNSTAYYPQARIVEVRAGERRAPDPRHAQAYLLHLRKLHAQQEAEFPADNPWQALRHLAGR